jgi:hypothetical protein
VRAVTSANVMEAVAPSPRNESRSSPVIYGGLTLKFNNSTVTLISLITQLILPLSRRLGRRARCKQ